MMCNYTIGEYNYITNYGYGLIVTIIDYCSDQDAISFMEAFLCDHQISLFGNTVLNYTYVFSCDIIIIVITLSKFVCNSMTFLMCNS